MSEYENIEDDAVARALPRRTGKPSKTTTPEEKEFEPWHKPRKQWVRKYQWHQEIVDIIQSAHFPLGNRYFRYLSLPGDDLLDVRVARTACEKNGLELMYLGLNKVATGSKGDLRLNLAEDEVKGLPGVYKGSKVLRDRFEDIARLESIAFSEVQDRGPYHAINVDLCDYIGNESQDGDQETIIDAIARIITLQIENGAGPWVLFLTTRVGPGKIEARNLASLVRAIIDNMNASGEFADAARKIIERSGDALEKSLDTPDRLSAGAYKDLFCIGFGKWLLSYIKNAKPQCALSMKRSCYYSVHAGNPDMLSLVFRVDVVKQPPRDDYGMVESGVMSAAEEVSLAMGLLAETQTLFDLDQLLASEPHLNDAMITESEALLREAHFDVDHAEYGYRQWLADPKLFKRRKRSSLEAGALIPEQL